MLADVGATDRGPWAKNADSLSGSAFEQVFVDGRPHVVKHLARTTDWIMRALDDGLDGRPPYTVTVWRTGLLDGISERIDPTVVAAAWDGRDCALLMRDESAAFVPTGFDRLPLADHHQFLNDMAWTHARFAGFVDTHGLVRPGVRYQALTPAMSAREAAAGHDDPVPKAIPAGWAALAAAAPDAYEVAAALGADPAPLVAALWETPGTLVHGDWKFGNLGRAADGRTILVDWAWPGEDRPAVDLAWYLAVNCDRLPESKEDAIAFYRARLDAHGFPLAGWARQLELALVGGFVQLGWSKTGDPLELDWWVSRIVPVGRDLLR
jgi:hypothetical protein